MLAFVDRPRRLARRAALWISSEKGFSTARALSAAVVLLMILVPAMDMLSSALNIDDNRDEKAAGLAQCKLDEVCAGLAADREADIARSGDFAAAGQAYYCYYVTTGYLDGGDKEEAMGVAVTVWHDGNGDGIIGMDEECTTLYAVVKI